MDKRIKKIDRTLKYEGHRVKVYEDTMLTPDGEKLYYDYVENRNGAAVLLVDAEGKLVFHNRDAGPGALYRHTVSRQRHRA